MGMFSSRQDRYEHSTPETQIRWARGALIVASMIGVFLIFFVVLSLLEYGAKDNLRFAVWRRCSSRPPLPRRPGCRNSHSFLAHRRHRGGSPGALRAQRTRDRLSHPQ